VPKQTRSTRARRRPVRPGVSASVPPSPLSTLTAAEAAPSRPALVPVAAARAATPQTRGIVTDYGYVIGELRRIFVLTAGILILLLALWLVIR